ncbi:MAG: polysaccharide export protein [Deltaproteobacteria bacterium]|nr:polysaccharide export protein [Deltaproteobacteria bacterium]
MKRLLVCFWLAFVLWPAALQVAAAWAGESNGGQSPALRNGDIGQGGDYRIGKGDVLDISVWREPMLSGETLVRSDGMISVALLGDVKAMGRTPMELRDEIQNRLKEYLGEPAVTVTVKTPVSQKFYVVGEVRTPGEYDLVKELTVVQAIARAGGFTEWAVKDQILLIRKEGSSERKIKINYKEIVKGKDSGQNLTLRADDTIVVP